MKTSKLTDVQIAMALRQAEAGAPAVEISRESGSASRPSAERLAELRISPAAGVLRICLIRHF